jgi:hypothetical protein
MSIPTCVRKVCELQLKEYIYNKCSECPCWWLIGPHVLPQPADNHSWGLLLHDLPKLPEDVPVAVRAWMWYMHYGALAHFSLAVRYVLNNTYHDWWIDRGGPTACPSHSPDVNALDFYLWGHLKPLVYATSIDNEEAFHDRIVVACQTIHNYPCIIEWMWRSWWDLSKRALSLLEDILSTYYKCTLSAITHKLNVSWRIDTNIFSFFGVWNSCPKFVCTFSAKKSLQFLMDLCIFNCPKYEVIFVSVCVCVCVHVCVCMHTSLIPELLNRFYSWRILSSGI